MASENSSIKSAQSGSNKATANTPSSRTGSVRRVGFSRPTLIIPPTNAHYVIPNPYSAKLTMTATPEMYGRKASKFVFDQFQGMVSSAKSGLGVGEKCAYWLYSKLKSWSRKWFTHFFLTIVLVLYTVGGALSFIALEGPYEDLVYELDIRTNRYELIEQLTNLTKHLNSENKTDQWMKEAEVLTHDFVARVIDNHKNKLFIEANIGNKVWSMWNAIVFCATIFTTIGYGHMCPKTLEGRILTIVYALIGIPLFLIALTDFGKLFTRCIKFLWSFVRRLYYTSSCRNVRKTAQVQEIFKGAQMMYEIATFRRPSTFIDPENPQQIPTVHTPGGTITSDGTPTTPAISVFEIDDEFNLPISVALFILVAYIFCGAVMYMLIENWRFFESFYFVFISMSTIGFGDYVPRHPVFMIASIVYLVFGLALMSMSINVVQAKLSETFKQASAKIGATMGLQVDEDGSIITVPPDNVEIAEVHLDANKLSPHTPNSLSVNSVDVNLKDSKYYLDVKEKES